ncbi:MAG: 7-carboxy-7-deazaguanine synthase QueE [Planctomycetota bacterium]|jgi:7-carboxy-7-deazaguanine synthase
MNESALKINEIFYSIQGESSHSGRPCIFVRLTHCNLRCTWCDSEYTFHEGESMTLAQVMTEVARHPCKLVEVTGGEPLAQAQSLELMRQLCEAGYEVLLETSGSLPIADVDSRVKRIVDFKCPGSGMSERNLWSIVEDLNADDEVKFVIADQADYQWARAAILRHGLHERCTVLMSPVFGSLENVALADWILADGLPVRFQIQLHKYVWDPSMRGV